MERGKGAKPNSSQTLRLKAVFYSSTQLNSMKQGMMDGDEAFLPEDIIINILKRLLVKSLIRFQCVCKHWKNLIKVPPFIADHLHHSARQNPSLLYQGYDGCEPSGWCFFNQEMQVVKAQSAPIIGSLSSVVIMASINGLLCFKSGNGSLFLWNPATREVRQVSEAVNVSESSYLFTGFGFSAIVNDYKIVSVHTPRDKRVIVPGDNLFEMNQTKQAFVYSLTKGSWKEIDIGNLDGISVISKGFHANGAIFWCGFMQSVGEQDVSNRHLVISFDLASEVFTLIPLPSAVSKSYRNDLTVHENKLAMLCCTTIGNLEISLIDLWVMEEGKDATSERWNWTKKYSTDPFPYLLHSGTIWGNEIVYNFSCLRPTRFGVKFREGRVVLFNITSNEFKMCDLPECGDGWGWFLNYAESLVSVGNNLIEEF